MLGNAVPRPHARELRAGARGWATLFVRMVHAVFVVITFPGQRNALSVTTLELVTCTSSLQGWASWTADLVQAIRTVTIAVASERGRVTLAVRTCELAGGIACWSWKIQKRLRSNNEHQCHYMNVQKLHRATSKPGEQRKSTRPRLGLNPRPSVHYTRKNARLVNKLCSQQACKKLVNKL